MRRKRMLVGLIIAVALVAVLAWVRWPRDMEHSVDLAALEAQELLAQYSAQQADGAWPDPAMIRTELLVFTEITAAADGARVDHYRVADPHDTRSIEVQLYPDGNLQRVHITD